MLQRYHGLVIFIFIFQGIYDSFGFGRPGVYVEWIFFWGGGGLVPDELPQALDLRFTDGVTYTWKSGGLKYPPAAISLSSFREREEKTCCYVTRHTPLA